MCVCVCVFVNTAKWCHSSTKRTRSGARFQSGARKSGTTLWSRWEAALALIDVFLFGNFILTFALLGGGGGV